MIIPLLRRSLLISFNPICQFLRLLPMLLKSFAESLCLPLCSSFSKHLFFAPSILPLYIHFTCELLCPLPKELFHFFCFLSCYELKAQNKRSEARFCKGEGICVFLFLGQVTSVQFFQDIFIYLQNS